MVLFKKKKKVANNKSTCNKIVAPRERRIAMIRQRRSSPPPVHRHTVKILRKNYICMLYPNFTLHSIAQHSTTQHIDRHKMNDNDQHGQQSQNQQQIHQRQIKELLNPYNCYNPHAIRSFLRYSRKYSDDNLHNALPRTGSCVEYITGQLYPHWFARDSLLTYCQDVSELKSEPRKKVSEDEPEKEMEKSERPDPRFDPYGARDYGKEPTAREEEIKTWVSTERNIEAIIRQTSAEHLARKCGSLSASAGLYMDNYTEYKQQH